MQNLQNASIRSDNTSGVRGVWQSSESGRWVAEIMVRQRKIALGRYRDKAAAVEARRRAELKYFGEFSPMAVTEAA
jgi:hypothetical protein